MPLDPVLVISPHLDDAVFSCGCLLAAACRPVVVTVLAGVPDARIALQDWDRAAGFSSSAQAVQARREEDRHGLHALGAEAEWLGFLDGQYRGPGVPYVPADLAPALAERLASHEGGTVVAPMGLFHSDHILVSDACMLARQLVDGAGLVRWRWLFYEEAIHRRHPGVVQQRVEAWRREGRQVMPAPLSFAGFGEQKARAARAYGSQLPLFNASSRADLAAPEGYWALGA